jgi:hypothetical protein
MALRDTIAQLRVHSVEEAQAKADAPRLIEEWKASVEDLIARISIFLEEFVRDGSMSISLDETDISEDTLGHYRARSARVSVGYATLIIEPVGRMVVGASGRVDIHREGQPSERKRIRLLRVAASGCNAAQIWAITGPPDAELDGEDRYWRPGRPIALEKAVFEKAVDYLLRL